MEGIRRAMLAGYRRGLSDPRRLPKKKKKKKGDRTRRELKELRDELREQQAQLREQQILGGIY